MAAGDIVVVRQEATGRNGAYLDGTGDYIQANAHAVARVAANDAQGCYTAWIYLNDIAGTYTIVGGGHSIGAAEHFYWAVIAGKLQIHLRPAAAISFTVVETNVTLTARKWHHVCINHTGVRPDLYVDGAVSAMTDTVSTDLTDWYDELPDVDEFCVGATTKNNVETNTFKGAIGQVKYWNVALTADQIKIEAENVPNDLGYTAHPDSEQTILDTKLQYNLTMTDDATTDSGLGADNGTLVGHAVYGGEISDWSYKLNTYADVTGHAAEFMNSFADGTKYVTILKKGD